MALSFGLLFSAALLLVELVQLFGLPFVDIPGSITERRHETAQVLGRLASFKKDQLSRWLSDRRINARLMSSNQSVIAALRDAHAILADVPGNAGADLVAAQLGAMPSILAAQRYMEMVRTAYQSFYSIQLIDAKTGRVLIATPKVNSVGTDQSQHPLIIRAKEVGQKEIIDQIDREGVVLPALSIVRQVTELTPDGDIRLLGLMVFQFDLRQIITSSDNEDAQILGRTGEILVVGAEGTVLARSPDGRAVTDISRALSPVSHLAAGGNEGAANSVGDEGQAVMAAYRYINISPDIGWGLIVAQDESEILAPIHREAFRWFGFGAVVLFAVLMLTGLIARRLTISIRSLSVAASRVQNGDFSARAVAANAGELTLLVDTFNQMVERVGEAHTTLEHLVEERTRDLTEEIASRVTAENRILPLLAEKEALLNNTTIGIYMTENRVFTVCNRHLEVMLGYEPGQMLGKSTTILYPTEDLWLKNGEDFYSALRRTGHVECDMLLKRKNGSMFWSYVSGRPLDPNHPNGVIVWMMIDISARKTAEAELALSEERYKEIVEGSNAVVTTVDAAGKLLFANEMAARIFGLTPDQCVGRLAFDFVHPDDRKATKEAFDSWISEHRTHVEFENRQIGENGNLHHLLWSIRIHYDEDGKPLRLTSIARDTTELRKAQTALRLTQFSVDNAGEAVFWMAADCSILYANKVACNLLGHRQDQINDHPLSALIGNQAAPAWQAVYFALEQESSSTFESVIHSASGAEINVEVTASNVKFDGYERNCAFFRDISVRKEAEERLIRSNTELEQFAFIASHDLREPLRMVKLYAALIERRLSAHFDDDTRTFMGFVVDGATRMDSLINDLLEYSRLGRNISPAAPVNLQTVFDSVMAYLQGPLDDCNGTIEVADRLPIVTGHEGEMVRLFQNLIGNAIKYRSPNRTLKITINVSETDGNRCFSFADNGIGIAPEYQDKVFRVFQRLHAPGAHGGGTGIGLAICKKIAEHHGGRIWVESAHDEGSAFFVILPKVPAALLHADEQVSGG